MAIMRIDHEVVAEDAPPREAGMISETTPIAGSTMM